MKSSSETTGITPVSPHKQQYIPGWLPANKKGSANAVVDCKKCDTKVDKTNPKHRPIYVCKKCGKDVCYNCVGNYQANGGQFPILEAGCPVCKTWEPDFIPRTGPYKVPEGYERSQEYYRKYEL